LAPYFLDSGAGTAYIKHYIGYITCFVIQYYEAKRTLDVVVDTVSHLEQWTINFLPFERPLRTARHGIQGLLERPSGRRRGIVQSGGVQTADHEAKRVREDYGKSLPQRSENDHNNIVNGMLC